MGDANAPATPPAASGGISEETIAKVVRETVAATVPAAVKEHVAAAIKPLGDQVAQLSKGQESLQEGLKKAATAESVKALLGEQLTAAQQTQAASKARSEFAAGKLKGVPAVYADKLGNDPAKWDAEATAIRTQYQTDLKAAGIKAPAVSSDAGAGGGGEAVTPAQQVDTGKLKGAQLIGLAVKQTAGTPIQPATSAAGAAAGAAGAGGGETKA